MVEEIKLWVANVLCLCSSNPNRADSTFHNSSLFHKMPFFWTRNYGQQMISSAMCSTTTAKEALTLTCGLVLPAMSTPEQVWISPRLSIIFLAFNYWVLHLPLSQSLEFYPSVHSSYCELRVHLLEWSACLS